MGQNVSTRRSRVDCILAEIRQHELSVFHNACYTLNSGVVHSLLREDETRCKELQTLALLSLSPMVLCAAGCAAKIHENSYSMFLSASEMKIKLQEIGCAFESTFDVLFRSDVEKYRSKALKTAISILLEYPTDDCLWRNIASTVTKDSITGDDGKDFVRILIRRMHTFPPAKSLDFDRNIKKALLEAGIDIDSSEKNKNAALISACRVKNVTLVEYLISHGANVCAVDELDFTPLHRALQTSSCSKEIIGTLIEAGADVNSREGMSRRTPLHIAVQYDAGVEIVDILLDRGANVLAKKENDQTMFNGDFVKQNKYERLKQEIVKRKWETRLQSSHLV